MNAARSNGNASSCLQENYLWASTAKDTARKGQQGWSRCSPVRESLGLRMRGAHRRRDLSPAGPDQNFVVRLSQHFATAEGGVGFPGVLKRHERTHGEGHENDEEYPTKLLIHGPKMV